MLRTTRPRRGCKWRRTAAYAAPPPAPSPPPPIPRCALLRLRSGRGRLLVTNFSLNRVQQGRTSTRYSRRFQSIRHGALIHGAVRRAEGGAPAVARRARPCGGTAKPPVEARPEKAPDQTVLPVHPPPAINSLFLQPRITAASTSDPYAYHKA